MIEYEKLRNYINCYLMKLSIINRLSDKRNNNPIRKNSQINLFMRI